MTAKSVFIANVGINASHRGAASPLYPDGEFDLVPIPEGNRVLGRACLTYADLRWQDAEAVRSILGKQNWTAAAHNDPDLWNGVYGDLPWTSPRAAALRKAVPGDGILFLVRLRPFDGGFKGEPGFYFVGGWRIGEVYDVNGPLRVAPSQGVSDNPHVRKHVAGSRERFTLLVADGPPTRIVPPIRIERHLLASALPISRKWGWTRGRSELQVVGSYLRTVKAVNAADHPGIADMIQLGD